MRVSPSALILYLLVTTAGMAGIWYVTSQGQSGSRRSMASVSQTRDGTASTNSSHARLRSRAMNQFEDQLRKSLESLAPNQSMDSTLSSYRTPMPVVQPSRRTLDELDRKKNWMFLTPEELAQEISPQEFLKLKELDGEQSANSSKGSTVMDRYYERLEKQVASSLKPGPLPDEELYGGSSSKKTVAQQSTRREEADEPASVRQSESVLRRLVDPASDISGVSSTAPRLFGEAFNPSESKTFVDKDAHRAYMNEYQSWLNNSIGSHAQADLATGLPGSAPTSANGYRGSDLAGSNLRRSDFGATAAVINPSLSPPPLSDPNARALNQWNTMYEPPKVDTSRAPTPTIPPMEAPRRKFF